MVELGEPRKGGMRHRDGDLIEAGKWIAWSGTAKQEL